MLMTLKISIDQQLIIDDLFKAPSCVVEVDEAAGRAALLALTEHEDALDVLLAAAQDLEGRFVDALGYTYARGSYRRAWVTDELVYKIPNLDTYSHNFSILGITHNIHEVHAYHAADRVPMAMCRLAWDSSGIPVVIMETLATDVDTAVKHQNTYPHRELDDWLALPDASQIGWSHLTSQWARYDAGTTELGDDLAMILNPVASIISCLESIAA